MVSALAAASADVVVTSRDSAACQEVAGQVSKESGRRAFARACHVGRWEELGARLSALIGTRMAAGSGGSIISIASTAAIKPRAAYLPYAAAKAGLVTLSEELARAFGPRVRSNVVMAGPFATDITAGWDWDAFSARVEEFALARSYTTGAVIRVDGGEP